MIVVLAGPEDGDALWLAAALLARGCPVETVLPEELVVGARLTCRVAAGSTAASLVLHDGRVLADDTLALVVNRLTELPALPGVAPADAAYVAEEWRAAVAAWLRALPCPVLNPPRAATLAGPVLSPGAWRAAAAAHRIRCRPWSSGEPATAPADPVEVVCLGPRCLSAEGEVGPAVAGPLLRLATSLGAPLLGATFARDAGGWSLADLTLRPRLAALGEPVVAALAALAAERAAA